MNPTIASRTLGPVASNTGVASAARRVPELLADTGATESSNEGAFIVNNNVTLLVGAEPIRFVLRSEPGLATQVGSTDMYLPAGGVFTWTADHLTRYVYIEAADGASAYQAWVWKSS